jgi:hypothetical protein
MFRELWQIDHPTKQRSKRQRENRFDAPGKVLLPRGMKSVILFPEMLNDSCRQELITMVSFDISSENFNFDRSDFCPVGV